MMQQRAHRGAERNSARWRRAARSRIDDDRRAVRTSAATTGSAAAPAVDQVRAVAGGRARAPTRCGRTADSKSARPSSSGQRQIASNVRPKTENRMCRGHRGAGHGKVATHLNRGASAAPITTEPPAATQTWAWSSPISSRAIP